MSDIPTVTYYAYSGTRYIGQYSGEDSAVLAFIAGKGYTTGPKPLASDRDLWVSIIGDATAAATNAAASEVAAGVSETNAAASASSASSSALNAAASETAAGVSETNAAASETAAGVSETAAAASETAAAASETAAGVSETNAAASESAASDSEAAAAASETAAGVSETNAAASETAASVSASSASDSEVAAAASEAAVDTAISDAIGVTIQGYSAVLDATTASFTTGLKSKLDGIEASADVTDTTNVTAAGALMDSEVTNLADVKAFDPADYATATQGGKADSAQQPPSEGAFVDGDKTKLDGIEAGADVTDTANVTAAGALMDSEVTNLTQVKEFDATDYATAAQGTKADNALPKAGGDMTGTFGVHDADEDIDVLTGTTPSLSVTAAQVFTLTTSGNTTLSVADAPAGRAWVRTIVVTLGGAHTFAITSADWGDVGAPADLASGDVMKIQLDGRGSTFEASEIWRSTA